MKSLFVYVPSPSNRLWNHLKLIENVFSHFEYTCPPPPSTGTPIETTVNAKPGHATQQLCNDDHTSIIRIKRELHTDAPSPAPFEKQQQPQFRHSQSVEDNSSLPALQDLLDDFDSSRLEELAESLLAQTLFADVGATVASDAAAGGRRAAEGEGRTEPLSGPVVGPEAENLESGQDTHASIIRSEQTPPMYGTCPAETTGLLYIKSEPAHAVNATNPAPNTNTNNNTYTLTMKHSTGTAAHSAPTPARVLKRSTHFDAAHQVVVAKRDCYGPTDMGEPFLLAADDDIGDIVEVIEEVYSDDDELMGGEVDAMALQVPKAVGRLDGQSPASDHDSAYDSSINSPPPSHLVNAPWLSINYDDYQCTSDWPETISELFPSLA